MIEKSSMQFVLRDPNIWGVVLICSCPLLLPFGRSVEVPVLLMALLGALLLIKNWNAWIRDKGVQLFCGVFAVSWIPMLLSLPDAVNMPKTGEVVLNHLRFLFSGMFVLHVLNNDRAWGLYSRLLILLLAFWIIDALVQYWTGTDLFGIKPFPGRLSAMFGTESTKFGVTLAVFLPVLWEYARRHLGRVAVAFSMLIGVTVVVLAGQRAGWILVMAAAGMYVFFLSVWVKMFPLRVVAAFIVAAIVYAASGYFVSEKLRSGIDQSLEALSSNVDPQRNSIVHRFWIWKGAGSMFLANPVNGVGARGFRYAFEDYARPDDPYLIQAQPVVPSHSHQLLIEIATETGSLGLLGLFLMGTLLVRAALRASLDDRVRMLPYAVCVAAAYFPLNTHLAIYSAYWSQIVWYLIALYCAATSVKTESTTVSSPSLTRSVEK